MARKASSKRGSGASRPNPRSGFKADFQSQQVEAPKVPDPLEPWRERHKLYLDDAKERIGRTRNILLVIVAALATMWLGGIEKVANRMHAVVPAAKAAVGARKLVTANNLRIKAVEEAQAKLKREGSNIDELKEHGDRLKKLQAVVKNQQKSEEAKVNKLQETIGDGVDIKFLGVEFPIPPVLSPSIWLLLAVGMIGYILAARRGIYRSLGRALRIERKHLCIAGSERLTNVPWWLDPLPTTSLEGGQALELDLAIGWRPGPRWCSAFAFLAGIFLLPIGWCILAANRQLLSDCADPNLGDYDEGLRTLEWQLSVAKIAPGVLVAIGVALIAYWRRTIPIADHLPEDILSINQSRSIGRRRFVNLIFATSCGGVAAWAWWRQPFSLPIAALRNGKQKSPRNVSKLLAKIDRIRNRRKTPIKDVKPSYAYMNSNSKAPRIHISTTQSSFRFPKQPKEFNEETIDFAKFQPQMTEDGKLPKDGKRIALAEAGWALELKAIEAANEKRFSDACDILLCAVRHDLIFAKVGGRKPNFRLYDLLAGLSVRGKTDHLDKMAKLVKESPLLPAFRDRIRTWSDSNGRWKKRWASETKSKLKVWEASVADAKDLNAQKKVLRLSINS